MKEGWEFKKLGEICDFRSGFAFKSNKFTKMGEPIIRISDIQNEEIDDSNLVYFDPKSYTEDLSKYLIYPDDILIAMSGGTTGKLGINTSKRIFYLNQRVGVFRENKKYLNHRYLYYYLHTKSEESLRIAAGAAQPNLSTAQIKSFIIPVPPLSQQQSIVDYLDSAFAKIDAMKANAEKALNEAKALFQASLKEMLEPKEGWEEKKLGDIAEDSADGPFGSNLKKEHYTTQKEVRIIQLSNIGEDGWREENTKYTTFEHLKNISRSEVEPNDIVIAKMMPAGRAILCPSHEPKFVLSSDAVKIKLKKGMETRFILHSINSPYFRNEVYENVTGSGRVRTSLTKLRVCSIFLPPLSEQQSIVATLDSLKSKVDRLQENYDKISQECDALKQAILRQVFE